MSPLLLTLLATAAAQPSSAEATATPAAPTTAIRWRLLEPGLELAEIPAPRKSSHGDSVFTAVRIDPEQQSLLLLSVSELGGKARSADAWARDHGLHLVANAGMFQAEGAQLRATFYMQNFAHLNNPRLGRENAVLAFNPVDDTVPPAQIIDRRCQDFSTLRKKYKTLIQGIRMVSCKQKNTWSLQPQKWSMVVVAVDGRGRVLFIFTRSPYQVRPFVSMLLGIPLDIHNMMYLEGGPEASLLVDAGGVRLERMGSYETGFFLSDENDRFWPIPNVIGVRPRAAASRPGAEAATGR